MNKVIFIALLLTVAIPCTAQKILYAKAVAGNYWMREVKDLHRELHADVVNSGIPAKIISSFPASIQAELGMDFTVRDHLLRKFMIGGFINYALTRGRINYTDYSGSVDVIQDLKRVTLGIRGVYGIGQLELYGKAGIGITSLGIISRTTLQGSGTEDDDVSFDAMALVLEPGVQWTKELHRFRLIANAGYEVNINGRLMYDEESHLTDSSDRPVHADWSGFRAGVGIGFTFK